MLRSQQKLVLVSLPSKSVKQDKVILSFVFPFDCDRCAASTSVASRIFILRGLKDIKVKRQEKQRTCPPGQSCN